MVPGSDPPPAATEAPLPERIGRYRIRSLLGKGGMGAVFEAEQESPKRTVALKVVTSAVLSDDMRRRFELEAQVLGQLQHPCIAQVYEAGMFESAGGAQPFFAMERIHGLPLVQYADRHQLDTRARLALLARICDGIQHAHQRGVIHRDLKPDNILVDAEGQPKILDFGLARATDADVQAATLHTDVGQIMGTIPYMSPEQALGDPARIDARSDVYSLGVVAYQLVSGHMPYAADDPMVLEALRVVREVDARPLSSIHRSLRGDVETIIGKALEKEPGRRYPYASALADDIRRFLGDEPITARPPSAVYQLRKFVRRNRAPVLGLAAVFVALVIGLVGTARGYVAAEDNARRAQSTADFFQTVLTGVDPLVAQGADTTLLRSILDDSAARIDVELGDQPLVAASLHDTMASAYRSIAAFDAMLEQATAARERYVQELGPDSLEAIGAHQQVCVALTRLERRPEAYAALAETLERIERTLGPEHVAAILARSTLGTLYLDEFRYEEATPVLERVLAYTREHFASDSDDVLVALASVGLARMGQRRYDEAQALLEEVREGRERAFGANHPDTIKALLNLASLHKLEERFDEAEALYREGIARADGVLGAEHRITLVARESLAELLRATSRHREAVELQRAVHEAKVAAHGADDPRTLQSEDTLGLFYRTAGELGLAEEHALHATEGLRAWFGPEHEETLSAEINLATVYSLLGEDARAEELRRRLIETYTRTAGAEDPRTLLVTSDLAAQHGRTGNLAEAEALHRRVLEARRRVLGEGKSETLMSASMLGRMVDDQGRADEALPLLAEFLVGWSRLYGDADAYVQDAASRMSRDLGRVERLGPHEAAVRTLLDYHRRTLPADAQQVATDLVLLAQALAEEGRPEEAREPLEEASELYTRGDAPVPARWFHAAGACGLISSEDARGILVQAWEDAQTSSSTDERRLIALWLAELAESERLPDEAARWRDEAGASTE